MSEEKKVNEIPDEELSQVAGGKIIETKKITLERSVTSDFDEKKLEVEYIKKENDISECIIDDCDICGDVDRDSVQLTIKHF